MYRKQRLDTMESRLMSRKGLIKGKHTLIRPVVYTNHQQGLWLRARVMLKMQDSVWKHMKVLAKSRMLWLALDSAEGLGDTLALWIYWTRWLCLYRVRIMEPLAQKMSIENDISGNATKAAYIEPEMFSRSAAAQYPESLVFVMFVLRHFSETYSRYRGKMRFTSRHWIQKKEMEKATNFGALTLRFFQQ